MGENSKIEWTHHTFNPWRGCSRVAEGCRNCYADRQSKRNPGTLGVWGPQGTRVVASEEMWRQPLKWDRAAKAAGERRRVFCASLADVFEDWDGVVSGPNGGVIHHGPQWYVPGELVYVETDLRIGQSAVTLRDVRLRLFALIDQTPHLDWLLLTKRPENVLNMWPGGRRDNVWLGTSIATQADADRNISLLLQCRELAPVLFLSCEPLIEAVDLGLSSATCNCCPRWPSRWIELARDIRGDFPVGHMTTCPAGIYRASSNKHGALSVTATNGELLGVLPREMTALGPIDWVIVGGESGPGARPMHPDWARSIRDQCRAAGVPFFMKQWGEWVPYEHDAQPPFLSSQHGDMIDGHALPDLVEHNVVNGWWWPDPSWSGVARKVGKSAAGRLLDGREWSEFPRDERGE